MQRTLIVLTSPPVKLPSAPLTVANAAIVPDERGLLLANDNVFEMIHLQDVAPCRVAVHPGVWSRHAAVRVEPEPAWPLRPDPTDRLMGREVLDED